MFKTQKNFNHHFTQPTKAIESYREFIKSTGDCGIFWGVFSKQRVQNKDKKTLWDPPLTPMSSMQQTKGQEISPHLFSSTRPPSLLTRPHHLVISSSPIKLDLHFSSKLNQTLISFLSTTRPHHLSSSRTWFLNAHSHSHQVLVFKSSSSSPLCSIHSTAVSFSLHHRHSIANKEEGEQDSTSKPSLALNSSPRLFKTSFNTRPLITFHLITRLHGKSTSSSPPPPFTQLHVGYSTATPSSSFSSLDSFSSPSLSRFSFTNHSIRHSRPSLQLISHYTRPQLLHKLIVFTAQAPSLHSTFQYHSTNNPQTEKKKFRTG